MSRVAFIGYPFDRRLAAFHDGRFATEEISRWRGPEPAINEVMRR